MQATINANPNAERCPWCVGIAAGPRVWKGKHAATQHPEEWAAFKNYYIKKVTGSVTWEEPDAE